MRIPTSAPASQTPSIFSTASGGSASSGTTGKKRNWADMEETLGANWLNKIGTAAFVIGVALLLNYSMHYLGPVGKIVAWLCTECDAFRNRNLRRDEGAVSNRGACGARRRMALAYFTTYALHNVQSVRLVESAGLRIRAFVRGGRGDGGALAALRFRTCDRVCVPAGVRDCGDQRHPVGGLVTSALLAASLVVILRVRRWFVVEPLAIVATYAVH